ncbi:MAG: hypothetical protein ABMB14_32860, partial [Myxococcota bacterium]
MRARLTAVLATLAGCQLGGTKTDTGTPIVLDDIACLSVPIADTCPTSADAETELVGFETCEDPVREVIATGAFVSVEQVVYTGYGGWNPYAPGGTGDTGGSDTGGQPMNRCCYEAAYVVHAGTSCTIGRPLVVDGCTVTARTACRSDWSRAATPDVGALSASARAELAAAWTEAGLLEHASIPAFARLVLDLVALGAPAALVARTSEALTDEVRHAEVCFALASAYAGAPVGPAPLPVPTQRRTGLERLAVETFREGCVGETLAVAVAAAQLRDATDPAVRAALAG